MKGYPKSRFEIVNQLQTQTIDTTASGNNIALYMQLYTSDKGSEGWELLTGFDGFTKTKGGMSFAKHGQAQLTVAQALRSGAYVLGKRLVSDDAALANVTVMARVVKTSKLEIGDGTATNKGDTSNVYFYTTSVAGCTDFEKACEDGVKGKKDVNDIPLLTITAMGRGVSAASIRIAPEYSVSRNRGNANYAKYSFEVIENNETLENIIVSMNPDIITNGAAQGFNPKIRANSNQVRVKLYDEGVYALVSKLAETAVDANGESIPVAGLINLDFINGCDLKGNLISGIATAGEEHSVWESNRPEDIIDVLCDLSAITGIQLKNGSYGAMGSVPMNNTDEIEKLMLEAITPPADRENSKFDTIIYDLDAYKIDCTFDCAWSNKVKNAIIDLIDFRGDMVFLTDLGKEANSLYGIKEIVTGYKEGDETSGIKPSNNSVLYHNYFNIIDPFSKKEITVTMPYLLIDKMTNHIAKGVGRPFAGIANNIVFDGIIENSVNFFPVSIPGLDEKQELVEMNVNYLSLYDGVPVMETMYVNDTTYSQLSYLHNIMLVQDVIKTIRTKCPQTRYTFLDGDDLETYISDVQAIVREYSSSFKSISCEYMADERYEQNNIFYAVLKVQFKNFIQEEYFKIIAIS